MKKTSPAGLLLLLGIAMAGAAQAQTQNSSPNTETRPRRISTPSQGQSLPLSPRPAAPDSSAAGQALPEDVPENKPATRPAVAGPAATAGRTEPSATALPLLSPPLIQARIAEAERLMKSRPRQTAMTSPSVDLVTLAALDRNTSRIHLITLYKDTFLTKGAEAMMTSSQGT
ncbi:MAG TPA: hypothetical protein DHU55_14555, partial [Blastocatellia bacterium]|nr:hypothetical protein [Blastocatellia bacterium]